MVRARRPCANSNSGVRVAWLRCALNANASGLRDGQSRGSRVETFVRRLTSARGRVAQTTIDRHTMEASRTRAQRLVSTLRPNHLARTQLEPGFCDKDSSLGSSSLGMKKLAPPPQLSVAGSCVLAVVV